jgi:hypothetical protein
LPNQALNLTRQPAAKNHAAGLPFPRGVGVEMFYNRSAITPSCSAQVSAKSVGQLMKPNIIFRLICSILFAYVCMAINTKAMALKAINDKSLTNTCWKLVGITSIRGKVYVKPNGVIIGFTEHEIRIRACNVFAAKYYISGKNDIHFEEMNTIIWSECLDVDPRSYATLPFTFPYLVQSTDKFILKQNELLLRNTDRNPEGLFVEQKSLIHFIKINC